MNKTILTISEVAERWGMDRQSVKKLEDTGILRRAKNMPGVRYNIQEVIRVEETKDLNPLTAWERKKLEKEKQDLIEENKKLRQILSNISVETSKFLGGNYENIKN